MDMIIRSNAHSVAQNLLKFKEKTQYTGFLALIRMGDFFLQEVDKYIPRQTGRLQDSIGNPSKEGIYEFDGFKGILRIGTNVPYSIAVNEGIAAPYYIYPKTAKMLSWIDDTGKRQFRRSVLHPSMTGKFFMNKGLIDAAARFSREFKFEEGTLSSLGANVRLEGR